MNRRGFIAGLGALLAAPAIIRTPGLLMPVKAPPIIRTLTLSEIVTTTLRNRAGALAESVTRNNALLERLKAQGALREVSGGIQLVNITANTLFIRP